MNLAYRDIRHNLGRFLLTCVGLGLLLGVVMAMIGIYRGLVVESLAIARAPAIDLWVVEANTRGPFAEASRIPADVREAVARISGVAAAGGITYQTVEAEYRGDKLRLYVIGYEPTRPGGPSEIVEGRAIARNRHEMVVDRSAGVDAGDRIRLGRNLFTVVGITRQQVNAAGDPAVYITLDDAQKLQFELSPPAQRVQSARGASVANPDTVNAVVARLKPAASAEAVAETIRRWKHLSAITQEAQEAILSRSLDPDPLFGSKG
jgi:putative ABC transport system permease protein